MLQKRRIVRKNLRLDQEKLTRAKELLGAHTETEAIDQLLDNFLVHQEIMGGIRRLRELGVWDHLKGDDAFEAHEEP